ncbi:hypothetical protein LX36DRAFT_442779 [Colletotrichum falcatum]|nr:hypothetical protein LX36DRAFT_442779 [Colletotrichum falcatum]
MTKAPCCLTTYAFSFLFLHVCLPAYYLGLPRYARYLPTCLSVCPPPERRPTWISDPASSGPFLSASAVLFAYPCSSLQQKSPIHKVMTVYITLGPLPEEGGKVPCRITNTGKKALVCAHPVQSYHPLPPEPESESQAGNPPWLSKW